jgi:DNA repair protein RadC
MQSLSTYEQATIRRAVRILERQAGYDSLALTSPDASAQLAFTRLAGRPAETFAVAFLDNRHRLIAFEELFHGTIDGASAHPRVVVQRALTLNAAAVVLAHNHPSGTSAPSQADIAITRRLRDALALVDVRVLDHLVVGDTLGGVTSFAAKGLI